MERLRQMPQAQDIHELQLVYDYTCWQQQNGHFSTAIDLGEKNCKPMNSSRIPIQNGQTRKNNRLNPG
jgi:hypothetical protein